jgi:hypothetical protein
MGTRNVDFHCAFGKTPAELEEQVTKALDEGFMLIPESHCTSQKGFSLIMLKRLPPEDLK